MNEISPYPQERLLVDAVAEMAEAGVPARRVISTSAGLAQFAGAAARALPEAIVCCTYLDLYRAKLALEYWRDGPANLRIECAADLAEDDGAEGSAALPGLPTSVQLFVTREASSDAIAYVAQLMIRGTKIRLI